MEKQWGYIIKYQDVATGFETKEDAIAAAEKDVHFDGQIEVGKVVDVVATKTPCMEKIAEFVMDRIYEGLVEEYEDITNSYSFCYNDEEYYWLEEQLGELVAEFLKKAKPLQIVSHPETIQYEAKFIRKG